MRSVDESVTKPPGGALGSCSFNSVGAKIETSNITGRGTRAAHLGAVAHGGRAEPGRELVMPQPKGRQLKALRAHRSQLRETYLRREVRRPATTARGLHHLALIARDVEETIRF